MTKQEQLIKDRKKALGELLIGECKEKIPNIETLKVMVDNGADVTYNYAKAVYWAAKSFNFEAVEFLIEQGALSEQMCKTYIANICNYKNYRAQENELESGYFHLMEKCVDFYGDRLGVYTPYIIFMAVHGRMDKLKELIEKYYLTEREVAGCIPTPIIFEIILHNYEDILSFINKHVKWVTQEAFDRAVERGDWLSLEYMINNSSMKTAGAQAVNRAVYFGEAEVLDILIHYGLKLTGEKYLKSACEASRSGSLKALEVLLKRGYSINDKYDGLTIKENAIKDKNKVLLDFITLQTEGADKP